MSRLADSLTAVADTLTAAGIPATVEPRDLQIPGAWVTLHDVIDPTLCGEYTVRARVCLIASDNGMTHELDALGRMLDLAYDAVTFDEAVTPMTVTPPGMGPLPALVITTTTD